jgi:hypothetical protein
MLINCFPRRKIICGFSPPRAAIRRRARKGYSICVASGVGNLAAVGAKIRRRVEAQIGARRHAILSCGTAPRTMVQVAQS